jgi:hypothetical protein
MALVLPAAITSGVAWEKTRTLIDAQYALETVVSSHHAPDRWAFSENTSLSEVLLVARKMRSTKSEGSSTCVFVNLWRNPSSTAEAIALADVIARVRDDAAVVSRRAALDHGVCSIMVGESKWGELLASPLSEVRHQPWLGSTFAQTDLVRTNWLLHEGNLSVPGASQTVPMQICPLGRLVEFGPDRRDVHDGFTVDSIKTAYPALWVTTLTRTARFAQRQTNISRQDRNRQRDVRRVRRVCCGHAPAAACSSSGNGTQHSA